MRLTSSRAFLMIAACGLAAATASAAASGVAVASPAGGTASRASAAVSYPSVRAALSAKYCGRQHVTVVVDFTHWHNGRVWVRCASNPRTGLAALRQAGFSYTFVSHQPGFVCTINHRPNPCNGAPSSAYWTYWHARHGGHWTYSTLGAGSYHPKHGQVEGWAFGATKKPRISPP